jgi:hypothetical protein
MILQNLPKSPFKKGGLFVESKNFPPFVKGGFGFFRMIGSTSIGN